MAGFFNGTILVADNVDFSGGYPPTDSVTADGELLIGSTAAPNIRTGSLTSTGGTLTISVGSGTINLEADASVATQYDCDTGSAVPALNILTVAGGANVATSGSGSTVTIDATGLSSDFLTDSGTSPVVPDGSGQVTLTGGGGLVTTTGSLNTVTFDLAPVWASIHPDGGTDPVVADSSNEVTVVGDGGIATTGSLNTLTIGVSGGGNLPLEFLMDGGTSPVVADASNQITVTGAGGISTTGGTNTITIQGSDGISWVEVVGTTQSMAVDTGYIANNASQVDLTLPASAALGDRVRVVGKGAGGWTISQNAGQTIHFLTSSTTTGVGGSVTPTEDLAAIELLCTTANTDWTVLTSLGNFTIV